MGSNRTETKTSALLSIAVFVIIAVSGYLTIADLAGKQSQQQQQSISPVFSLIERELLQPLQIATTLSKVGVYDDFFSSEEPDENALMKQLRVYEERFGLPFYLAHDKSRQQFNSDGRIFDLIEGEVVWYFALKEQNDFPVQAVLGKREDVHLFIDVRQYDQAGEFIGFVGVGKSLKDFLSSFAQFRSQYGHEFVFVNNSEEIVLSSIAALSPEQAEQADEAIGIKSTSDISWFEEFTEKSKNNPEPSVIVNGDEGDLLVSRLKLESLNWSLYIVTPLNLRQNQVNLSFTIYIALGLFLAFVCYKLLYRAIDFYLHRRSLGKNTDELTNLANREHANLFFNRVRKQERQIAIVVADIDDFKKINESFGAQKADQILKAVAEKFSTQLRSEDLLVRWGGDEFAFILPEMTHKEAGKVAEKCRKLLERSPIQIEQHPTSVTASFGYCASRSYADSLDAMMKKADRAMYLSKGKGKNCVSTICDKPSETDE